MQSPGASIELVKGFALSGILQITIDGEVGTIQKGSFGNIEARTFCS